MNLNFKMIRPFLEKHGPTILTGLASFGVILTGYLTHKAAMNTLSETTEAVLFEDDSDIPVKQTVNRVVRENWKTYIPPAISGLCTIACIIGSNQWHLSKEGALAAAALMYKTSADELEKKLREEFGGEKVDEIKKKIAEEKADKTRPPWVEKSPEKIMIWEPYSEQWFYASQKDLLWIEIMANKMLAQEYTVHLNDILKLYGLKPSKKIKDLGWSYDDEIFGELASYYGAGAWIDLCPQIIEKEDGTSYFQMEYGIHPNDISHIDQ